MKRLLSIALGATLSAVPAYAQTTGTLRTTTTTTPTSTTAPSTSTTTSTSSTSTSTSTTSTTTSSNQGAFAKLSPGNQKIAQALYDAQTTPGSSASSGATGTTGSTGTTSTTGTTPTTGTTATTGTPAKLSRDDIAAMKGSTGWGQVFKQMKAQGLVQAKNLGEVVSASHHASAPTSAQGSNYTSTGPVISTASGRTYVDARDGNEQGGGVSSQNDGGKGASNAHGSRPTDSTSHGASSSGVASGGARGNGVARGPSIKN